MKMYFCRKSTNTTHMKSPIPYLLFFMLLLGCKNTDQLTFEPISYESDLCQDCPKVSINIPKVLEKIKVGSTIENALREEVIFLLTFNDEIKATNIEEAILSFDKGYAELKNMYPDETAGWEAKITGKISYEGKKILTIQLDSYIFTGGAHGYSTTRFLNFDKKKGTELENWQLFKNTEDIVHFVEGEFRSKENIPQDKPINSTGFMFENDSFYLPENIGFTEKGLQLHYNQYEVASYADGPIVLTLPYDEVNTYLSEKSQ